MLIIKSLTFQNIGRFIESQTIDFESLGTLTLLEGKNTLTGGSSGSGKSTIFKALDFLLGLNEVSNSILQSRLTEDHIVVSGIFDFDGMPLKIERGKRLLIDLNGEITVGSSKITEEKLSRIIGMPRELFRKTFHKRQGESGFFLQMPPSETHKFLTNCLNLDAEQAKVIKLDELLKNLNDKNATLNTDLQSAKMGLEATNNAIVAMPATPILDIDQNGVDQLKEIYLQAYNAKNALAIQHSKEISTLEESRPQRFNIPYDRSRIDSLQSEMTQIELKIRAVEREEASRQDAIKSQIYELQNSMSSLHTKETIRQTEIERKLSDIRFDKTHAIVASNIGKRAKDEAKVYLEELKKIRESACPTCNQSWATEASRDKKTEISTKLKISRNSIVAGQEADSRLTEYEVTMEQLYKDWERRTTPEMVELDAQIASLTRELQNDQSEADKKVLLIALDSHYKALELLKKEEKDYQNEQLKKFQSETQEFLTKLNELKYKHQFILDQAVDNERSSLIIYQSAKARIESFEISKAEHEESSARLIKQSTHYQEHIRQILSQIDSIVQEIELAEEAKKAIKSYLSCSFDDALNSIGDDATRILRGIPNMATATISLEGIKETAAGKIKEEINAIISIDGQIGIPIKSLSGGERSSADFALDRAAVNFIEEKANQGINIMELDEVTNGLDSVCIQELVDMLTTDLKLDKKILLIEHNPIVSQSIENKIVVERNGSFSKIMQN